MAVRFYRANENIGPKKPSLFGLVFFIVLFTLTIIFVKFFVEGAAASVIILFLAGFGEYYAVTWLFKDRPRVLVARTFRIFKENIVYASPVPERENLWNRTLGEPLSKIGISIYQGGHTKRKKTEEEKDDIEKIKNEALLFDMTSNIGAMSGPEDAQTPEQISKTETKKRKAKTSEKES